MLRFTVVLLIAFIVALAKCEDEKYSDKYDDIDVKEILENERLRKQYYSCFMDTGLCLTADQSFFKGLLPEVIVTQCRKCTDKQKQNFDDIVTWYADKKPKEWDALVEKFVKDAQKLNIKSR